MSRSDSAADLVLVDDDELVHLFVQRRLRGTSLQLEAFTSSERALEWLRKNRPRLLVLDHHMPMLSGLELLDALGGPTVAAERTVLCSAASRATALDRLADCDSVTILDKQKLLDRTRFLERVGLSVTAAPPAQPAPANRPCSSEPAPINSGAL